MNEKPGSFENSPAIHGWVHRGPEIKSPAGTAERFFRPWRDFLAAVRHGTQRAKALGYYRQTMRRTIQQNPLKKSNGN
jgi:hypothetical protein